MLILGILGAPESPHTLLVARMLGAILLALGAMLVLVRDIVDEALCKRISVGNAIADLLIAGFVVKATAEGTLGPMGWVLVATFSLNVVTWMSARPRLA